jgi:hypothetical protein
MGFDLPPIAAERVTCSVRAAAKFGIPANVVLAVAQQEGGSAGRWVANTNGSFDIGTMQFNTGYIRTLARYGIGAAAVAMPGCYPYDLAAWRLRRQLREETGDLWTRVADYNSHTPWINARYRAAVMAKGADWGRWLAARWPDMPIAPAGPPSGRDPTLATVRRSGGRHHVSKPSWRVMQARAALAAPIVVQIVFKHRPLAVKAESVG